MLHIKYLFPLISFFVYSSALQIDEDFERVTCYSHIKLTNPGSGFKLHSHALPYGGGSRQQSVTGFPESDDPNSFFTIYGSEDNVCLRSESIKCGSVIRLLHGNTKKFLHSHLHKSPLSGNQEVSAYDGGDTGDDWKIECVDKSEFWIREKKIRLQHVDTGMYLSTSKNYKFGQPAGQLEVYGTKSKSNDNIWVAQEGIYFSHVL